MINKLNTSPTTAKVHPYKLHFPSLHTHSQFPTMTEIDTLIFLMTNMSLNDHKPTLTAQKILPYQKLASRAARASSVSKTIWKFIVPHTTNAHNLWNRNCESLHGHVSERFLYRLVMRIHGSKPFWNSSSGRHTWCFVTPECQFSQNMFVEAQSGDVERYYRVETMGMRHVEVGVDDL